jgi:hypothetical protein
VSLDPSAFGLGPHDRYAWSIPDLPDFDLADIASFCESVAARAPRLNYAFRIIESTELVAVGHSVMLNNAHGLTCATFVLAIFQSLGHPLVVLGTWPSRAEDADFQRKILLIMATPQVVWGISSQHIVNANAEIGCLRYRPEEVVGACRFGVYPVAFSDAEPPSLETLRRIADCPTM